MEALYCPYCGSCIEKVKDRYYCPSCRAYLYIQIECLVDSPLLEDEC